MKRPKISETGKPSSSSRNQLYQNVIDLDKSQEAASELVDSVHRLLGILDDALQTYTHADSHCSSSASPKFQWALRWCLTRLSSEGDAAESFRLNPSAWSLIKRLVRILPSKSSGGILVIHKFSKAVSKTLSSLVREVADNDSLIGASQGIDHLVEAKANDKKRKRAPETSRKRKAPVGSIAVTILEILDLLRSSNSIEGTHSLGAPSYLDVIFRLKPIEAVQLLADALSLTNHVSLTKNYQEESPVTGVHRVESLISIWNSAVRSSSASDVETTCLFLDHALAPCLLVFNSLRGFDEQERSAVSIRGDLSDLLIRNLILPFRSTFLNQKRVSRELTEQARLEHTEIRDHLHRAGKLLIEKARQGTTENNLSSSAITSVLEIAFSCCRRSTVTQKSQEDPWLEDLFHALSSFVDIDLTSTGMEGRSSDFSHAQISQLSSLLESARNHNLRLSKHAIQNAALHVSKLNTAKFQEDPESVYWNLVAVCLKSDPSIMFPTQSTGSLFTSTLFRTLSSFGNKVNILGSGGKIYQEVSENVLLQIPRMFSTARNLEDFLDLWANEIRFCIEEQSSGKLLDDSDTFLFPWTDERLLATVSKIIAEQTSYTQIESILQNQNMKLRSGTSSPSEILVALILGNSAITSRTSESPLSNIVPLCEDIMKAVASRLLQDETHFDTVHEWRGWRLLESIINVLSKHISTDTDNANLITQLCTKATKLFSKAFKEDSSPKSSDLRKQLFAFRFLVTLRQGTSHPDAAASFDKSVSSLVKFTKLNTVNETRVRSSTSSRGANFHISSKTTLFQYCVCVLVWIDEDWAQQAVQGGLLQFIFTRASSEDPAISENPPEISFRWIWRNIINGHVKDEERDLSAAISDVSNLALLELKKPSLDDMIQYQFLTENSLLYHPRKFEGEVRDRLLKVSSRWSKFVRGLPTSSEELQEASDALIRLITTDLSPSSLKLELRNSRWVGNHAESNPNIRDSLATLKTTQLHQTSVQKLMELDQLLAKLRTDKPRGLVFPTKDVKILTALKFSQDERSSETRRVISGILSSMISHVPISEEPQSFVQFSKFVLNILSRQAWAVTQFHIDALLSLVVICTSKKRVALTTASSSIIWTCLCRTIACILANHRAKVGGRYHLLTPALKGLLRCLFSVRSRSSNPSQLKIEQPDWITRSVGLTSPECASQLSRLLTSLCDPTMSAAKSVAKHKSQELNDPTKKARSIAGQHLRDLILEFCSCQLRGSLDPRMRENLRPGLFSILKAISHEPLQNMSAAMDSSQRAIFKTLYDDWRMDERSLGD